MPPEFGDVLGPGPQRRMEREEEEEAIRTRRSGACYRAVLGDLSFLRRPGENSSLALTRVRWLLLLGCFLLRINRGGEEC